jgi:endoglucanase
MPRSLAARALLAAIIPVALVTGCGASASKSTPDLSRVGKAAVRATHALSPLAGDRLYVVPTSHAAKQVALLRLEHEASQASAIERIAKQPTAVWLSEKSAAAMSARANALTSAASAAHAVPVIVAYDIPLRDCNTGYSAGGASTPAEYERWIEQLASSIGSHKAIVILEPDALVDTIGGCVGSAKANVRLALMQEAVRTLKRDRGVKVYIDAGNSNWIKPVSRLVRPLQRAGIAQADGFALNVANFQTNAASISYGRELSNMLHGAHFVVDTSRNGNGPGGASEGAPEWCNPPGRALGLVPSTNPGQSLVDAYLWIKQPGDSDGPCRPGAPAAGTFWLQYALGLVRDTH